MRSRGASLPTRYSTYISRYTGAFKLHTRSRPSFLLPMIKRIAFGVLLSYSCAWANASDRWYKGPSCNPRRRAHWRCRSSGSYLPSTGTPRRRSRSCRVSDALVYPCSARSCSMCSGIPINHTCIHRYISVGVYSQVSTAILTDARRADDILDSFDFEWAYITRKRKFRWPLVCTENPGPHMLIIVSLACILRWALHDLGLYDSIVQCLPTLAMVSLLISRDGPRLISVNVTTELNCQALLAFMSFAGSASVGFASLSLALRACVFRRVVPRSPNTNTSI